TVLPPSRHADGGLYEWLKGHGPQDSAVAPMPAWAVEKWGVKPGDERQGSAAGHRESTDEGCPGNRAAAVWLAVAYLNLLSPDRAINRDSWRDVGMALHWVWDGLLYESTSLDDDFGKWIKPEQGLVLASYDEWSKNYMDEEHGWKEGHCEE